MPTLPSIDDILFFKTPAALRKWFSRYHARRSEQWIGFHKRGSGTPSITWPESVDQALCFGWIDGLRKSIDETRYAIRFTPRRPTSIWSAINIRRVGELKRLGLMKRPGLELFERRDEKRSNRYSFEQRKDPRFTAAQTRTFRSNAAAWSYFRSRPPWYQRTATWWVISAKQDATRAKRLALLIHHSERKEPIPVLRRGKDQ